MHGSKIVCSTKLYPGILKISDMLAAHCLFVRTLLSVYLERAVKGIMVFPRWHPNYKTMVPDQYRTRIRNPGPNPRGQKWKMTHKIRKNLEIYVLMFSSESWRLLLWLGRSLGIGLDQFFFQLFIFFNFWSSKPWFQLGSGFGSVPYSLFSLKCWILIKWMWIRNPDKMYVILSAGDVVDCSRHLARLTDHPRMLLGYEVSIPYISGMCC